MATAAMKHSTVQADQLPTQQLPSAHSEALSSVASTSFAPATRADAQEKIILVYNHKYMNSLDCRIRLAQLVSTVVCLAFATSCRSDLGDYLTLPFTDNLRLFVFTCVVALLVGLFIVCLRLSSAVLVLPIDWNLFTRVVLLVWLCPNSRRLNDVLLIWVAPNMSASFEAGFEFLVLHLLSKDLLAYGMLSTLFLISSLLAVGDLANSNEKHQLFPEQAFQVYIVAMVFAVISSILHGMTSVLGCRRRQSIACFGGVSKPQRISLSQQSSVSTVTTEAGANS